MSVLDSVCKFKIGDFVTFKRPRQSDIPVVVGLVVERWLQECYGGQQASYRLRLGRRVETHHALKDDKGQTLLDVGIKEYGAVDTVMPMFVESELDLFTDETGTPTQVRY